LSRSLSSYPRVEREIIPHIARERKFATQPVYALRLHEIGIIKNTPQKIIAQGTGWHFLNELKKELKG
jgi:hypothetical protein